MLANTVIRASLPALCVGSVLLMASATARAQTTQPTHIERARTLQKMLVDGKFDDFSAACDETLRQQFPAIKVQMLWAQLTFQLGKYESEVSAKDLGSATKAVHLRSHFTNGDLTMRYVFNDAGELSGLWVDALDLDIKYDPPDYVDKDKFTEQNVEVGPKDAILPGTLTLPKTRDLHPAVVLVHGSGPNDRDETVGSNKPFRDLAWGLASDGVAVLRYVKRTKQFPMAKKAEDITLEYETIDDALSAVAVLRARSDIDKDRIFVLGHSLGAQAAPFIAQRDDKLAGIILLAGPARPTLDVLEDQIHYLEPIQNPNGAADADFKKLYDSIDAVRSGDTDQKILGQPGIYWKRLNDMVAPDACEKLTLPILIIQGGRDYQVTDKEFDIWKKRLADYKHVTFRRYPDLNHLMIAGKGPSRPQEYQQAGHVDAAVIHDVAQWIRNGGRMD